MGPKDSKLTFLTSGLITSIIRFTIFFQIDGLTDITWTAVKLGAISITEAGVYLMAACLPTYRPLVANFCARTGLHSSRDCTSKYNTESTLRGSNDPDTQTNLNLVSVQTRYGNKTFNAGYVDRFEKADHDESTLIAFIANSGQVGNESDKDGSDRSVQFDNTQRGIHVQKEYTVTSNF